MAKPTAPTTSRAQEKSDRIERARVNKFDARRAELADAALATLGDRGFARTSLREIAQNTDFSHGVFHYYFRDKTELITFCVRRYKEQCVTRYDEIVAESTMADALAQAFSCALVATLVEDTAMHRLWYDLRVQALFDHDLLPTVRDLDGQLEQMILRVITRYAELGGRDLLLSPTGTYQAFDGVFEGARHRHLAGDPATLERLQREAAALMVALTSRDEPYPLDESGAITPAGTP